MIHCNDCGFDYEGVQPLLWCQRCGGGNFTMGPKLEIKEVPELNEWLKSVTRYIKKDWEYGQ